MKLLSLLFAVLVLVAGCGSEWDPQAALDDQIEQEWIVDRDLMDAVQFFEEGGVYEDGDTDDDRPIDQPTVLPLMRRLRDDLGLNVQAVIDEPGFAFALLIELPEDETLKPRIREVLHEADQEFYGVIMRNWGHRWISLDFFDEVEMKLLADAGALEAIKEQNQ